MPDAAASPQRPVPPAAPAPQQRIFALDLDRRHEFTRRSDARNFLEQYLCLGCNLWGKVGLG